jgi:hypothetical protein
MMMTIALTMGVRVVKETMIEESIVVEEDNTEATKEVEEETIIITMILNQMRAMIIKTINIEVATVEEVDIEVEMIILGHIGEDIIEKKENIVIGMMIEMKEVAVVIIEEEEAIEDKMIEVEVVIEEEIIEGIEEETKDIEVEEMAEVEEMIEMNNGSDE